MKKVLLVLVVLIIIVGGFLGWRAMRSGSDTNTTKTTDPFTNKSKDGFVWGVTTRAHAIANFTPEIWATQVKLAKDLGVGYVRVNWENDGYLNGKKDPTGLNLAIINSIISNGMRPYIVLNQTGDMVKSADPYQDGYDLAYKISSAAKGKVDYYQLENEITSWSLKGAEFSGENLDEYDADKSAKIIEWLKGASAGIKAGDSKAKTVVTGQWVQYGFIKMLKDAKVDYDIIGWDWFSDMGLMQENRLADGQGIVDKLKSFKKPIMLVEVGQRPDGSLSQGFTMDEDKQNSYISSMATWAHDSGLIKGFFVFELTDLTNYGPGGYIDRYGLVQYEPGANKVGVMNHARKAYAAYKAIITRYNQ